MLCIVLPATVFGGSRPGGGANKPPIANPQSVVVTEDEPKSIRLTGSDPNGDALTYGVVSNPSHGTLSGTPPSLVYTPAPDYFGPDSFRFKVTDPAGAADIETVSITVKFENDAPVVTTSSGSPATYVENSSTAVAVDPGVTVSDVDDTKLEDAFVRVVNFQPGDQLTFTNQLGISGRYDPATGLLRVSGTASTSAYQQWLRGVRYRNASHDNPHAVKVFEFRADDGDSRSSPVTMTLTVEPVNDPPVLDTSDMPLVYTEDTGGQTIDGAITIADVDSAQLAGAVVRISGNFRSSEDELIFVPQLGIAGVYHDSTGTLTLSGTASVADYQTALRDVRYANRSDDPSTLGRIVSFHVTDGSAVSNVATRDIVVAALDDAPVAVDDDVSVDEDASASIEVLANDSDAESDRIDVTTVSDPAHGTAAIVQGSPDAISYTPDANYCNDPPATAPDAFTYTVNGGDTAMVRVTVECIDDPPVAAGDSATIGEDSGANSIDVLANDLDIDGGARHVESASDGANGTVAITGGGSGLTFTPNADFCGLDAFTYTLNGGSQATVGISVTCVNDPPAVDLNGGESEGIDTTAAFTETVIPGAGAVSLAPQVETSDVDDANLESATITLATRPDGLSESLSVSTAGTTIVASAYDPATGVITLTGSASKQEYANVLRTVSYDNSASPPTATDRTVEFKLNDGELDSTTAKTIITVVALRIPPSLDLSGSDEPGTDESATFTENGGPVNIVDSDLDADDADDANLASARITLTNRPDGAAESLSIDTSGTAIVASAYDPATGGLTLSGGQPIAEYEQVLRTTVYVNASDTPDTTDRSVTFTVSDGMDDSNVAVSTISVAATNDAPVNTVPGARQEIDEDISTTFSSANGNAIAVSDADAGADALRVTLTVTNGTLTLNGTTGISFSAGTGTSDQTMTFSGSEADINAALDGLVYTPDTQFNGADTLSITTTDQGGGGGGVQADSDEVALGVTAVNDGPVNTVPGAQAVSENGVLTFGAANSSSISVADPDSGPGDVRVALEADNGTLTLATTSGLSFTHGDGSGDATMAFDGTVAEVNAALEGLRYDPQPDYTGPALLTITTDDRGNSGSGGPLQDQDTVDIAVNPVNEPPVADDEHFTGSNSAVGNTTYVVNGPGEGTPPTPDPTDTAPVSNRPHKTVSGDILAGDIDSDGPGPLAVVPGTFPTHDGGTVTIEADGDFTVEPKVATSCTDHSDFFDYTVTDQNPGAPGTDTGRVTFDITHCVWYANNDDAQGDEGTSVRPFDTLAQAEAASTTGDYVFVYDGDGSTIGYAAGINLKPDQRLVGEAAALVVANRTLHPVDPANRPTLTDDNADVVDLAAGNDVRGLELDPRGAGGGIAGGSGDAGGTIDDVRIIDVGTAGADPGLELDGTTGTFNISDLTVDNSAATAPPSTAIGIRLNGAGTTHFAATGQNRVTTSGAKALDLVGTDMSSLSSFDRITVTGSGTGGIRMSDTTGSTQLNAGGSGPNMSLTTTGPTPALRLANVGTVSVPTGGISNITATGGPAVDVTGTPAANLSFDEVSSTDSPGDGVNLDDAGIFSALTGRVAGAAGIAFDVNAGSDNVIYEGALADGPGATAEVTNRTSGSLTLLSGPITDSDDPGGGITIVNNSGTGSIVFSGASKVLDTGTSDAVAISQPNGSGQAVTFPGGGLDIETTTGTGLVATGVAAGGPDGFLGVSGSGNSIRSSSGRALDAGSTNIDASELTFRRIDAGNDDAAADPVNGIRLNATGPNAGITVTGDGTAGSGGTIQNTTERGVSVTDAADIELNWMTLTNAATTNGADPTNSASSCGELSSGGNLGCNAPIHLVNVARIAPAPAATLDHLTIDGSAQVGINVNNVDGLALNDTIVSGIGDQTREHGIKARNLYGPVSVDTASIGSSFGDNVRVENSNNRATTVDVTDSEFSASADGSGFVHSPNGSGNTKVNVASSSFTGNAATGLAIGPTVASASATVGVDVTGGAITGNGVGIRVLGNGRADVTYDIHGIADISANPDGGILNDLSHTSVGGGTLVGEIRSNSITMPTTGSGTGIGLTSRGAGTSTVRVAGNDVVNRSRYGVHLHLADGVAGTMNATVDDNTVTTVDAAGDAQFPIDGIRVESGASPSDGGTLCASIVSNIATGANSIPAEAPGDDIHLRMRFAYTFRLPGLVGTTATDANNHVTANNPAATLAGASTTTAFTGGAACATP